MGLISETISENGKGPPELLNALFANTKEGIIVADAEKRAVLVNRSLCEMLGYTSILGENTPGTGLVSVPDQMLTEPIESLALHDKEERAFIQLKRKDGTQIQTCLVTFPMEMNGEPHYVGVARTICDHNNVISALRDSTQRYRSIVESSPMGMHMYKLENEDRLVFEGFNPAAENMLGVSHEQFVGKTIEEAFPPLAETEVPMRYRKAAMTGEPWSNQQIEYKDNQIAGAFEIKAFQTKPGSMAVMFWDITARKQWEEKLEMMQFSIDHCSDAVFWIGEDAKFHYANDAACSALEYEREEMLAMGVFDIDPNFPIDLWPTHWAQLRSEKHLRIESLHRKKDGTLIPVEIAANLIQLGDKEYNCAFARDITERKCAEQQLIEAHEKLEVRVEERTRELVQANEKLQQVTAQLVQSGKLAALGELTAGIAHELSQPLNGIKIISQGLLLDIKKGRLVQDDLPRKIDSVVHMINKMADIIQHMRIFTRQTYGTAFKELDLNGIVQNSFTFIEEQFKNNNITFKRALAEAPLMVRAEAVGLEQVVLNLLSNARYALIRSPQQERVLKVSTSSEAEFGVIEVWDNGIGISEEAKEKIFIPFFTTKDPGEGTGLGLSVSRKIVEENGGTIDFESRQGDHTRFVLKFPLVDPG